MYINVHIYINTQTHIHISITESPCCICEITNIINQLYPNTKKKKEGKKDIVSPTFGILESTKEETGSRRDCSVLFRGVGFSKTVHLVVLKDVKMSTELELDYWVI